MRKSLLITLPVFLGTALLLAACVELGVRWSWDPSRGRPGLFVADAARIEKLSAGYDGWFAGVPVRTNALGFRDDREYDLAKRSNTFRIIVLGDSVTFGHGSVYEHTYPLLLEQRLKAWRPSVDWQVWNLGVPGYNTSQELAYLLEAGPVFHPDLVVVGFYGNDVTDNRELVSPTRAEIVTSTVKTQLKRHLYSFDLYKKAALTVRYRLQSSAGERTMLETLAAQDQLLVKPSAVAALREQRLTRPAPLSEAERASASTCTTPPGPDLQSVLGTNNLDAWLHAVHRLQQLNRDGIYRIVFFINAAPTPCVKEDVFDTRVTKPVDDYFMKVLSNGTPAVSSHDAFARYRPSQMPEASAHSIGNSNALKADVLFQFLRDGVLK